MYNIWNNLQRFNYTHNTEQFTTVTILIVCIYGTIYGTHRQTPDTNTGHQHRRQQHFNLLYLLIEEENFI